MDKSSEYDWLRKRLDAVILLLLESSPNGAESMTRKIERLLEFGFSKPDVAQILGKKLNYVTAITSTTRRSKLSARKAE